MGGSDCVHVTRAVGRLTTTDLNQLLATKCCDVCRWEYFSSDMSLKLMLNSTQARCDIN